MNLMISLIDCGRAFVGVSETLADALCPALSAPAAGPEILAGWCDLNYESATISNHWRNLNDRRWTTLSGVGMRIGVSGDRLPRIANIIDAIRSLCSVARVGRLSPQWTAVPRNTTAIST